MQIKRFTIGAGRPLVCVPIVEIEEDNIYRAAKEATEQGAEAVEWRMDWFAQADNWHQAPRVAQKLADICQNTVLICTFRSKPQGGRQSIAQEDYIEVLQSIAKGKCADLLDVELPELSDPVSVIGGLHALGQRVIGSSHYFSYTPDTKRMKQELFAMRQAGADIGKLAVMPQKPLDVLRLLEALACIKEELPEYPLAVMAMGSLGIISRISGQTFGSCLTFASMGKASAPGQLPLEDAVKILDIISDNMD